MLYDLILNMLYYIICEHLYEIINDTIIEFEFEFVEAKLELDSNSIRFISSLSF